MMPEVEKQKALLDQGNNSQVQQMGKPQQQAMQPPTTREVAMRGLLR